MLLPLSNCTLFLLNLYLKIKVLLLKDVAKLGWKGQIVEVSDAVFRNVLRPKGEAKIADKKVIKEWERKQAKKAEQEKIIDEKILTETGKKKAKKEWNSLA